MHKDIKTSYLGGITELHRPAYKEGQVLYHYDVNFFCPYTALDDMAGLNDMPISNCVLENNINKKLIVDLDIFEFLL